MKNLTSKQIAQVSEIQSNRKCSWKDAYDMWNEDTSWMETGE